MLGKARMRLVCGIALFLAVVGVVAQSSLRGDMGNKPPYLGTALIAVFTFLFLSSKNEDENE
jgi:hypothetical protein